VHTRATVVRDGHAAPVSIEELVPGDVVNLCAGDLVPGDGVVLNATDFFVSEASRDPYVVKLIQAHAQVVSAFIANGRSEMMKNHPVP
jgi:high-affinity K+ transport system ATPase subunit B